MYEHGRPDVQLVTRKSYVHNTNEYVEVGDWERRHASSGEPMIAGLLFLAALVRQIVNDIRTWEPHALANGPIELHAVELFETRYSETPDHIGTVEVSYHADAKYSSIDGHLMMSASQWHALYGVTADGRAVLYAN